MHYGVIIFLLIYWWKRSEDFCVIPATGEVNESHGWHILEMAVKEVADGFYRRGGRGGTYWSYSLDTNLDFQRG